MSRILLAILIVICTVTISNSTPITGNGIMLSPTGVDDQFTGINGYLKFQFDDNTLTISNAGFTNQVWWYNFGTYVFSGFDHITNVSLASNNKFDGTFLNNIRFDDDSIRFNMNYGHYGYSSFDDQKVVFNITSAAPVPEPTTILLFGVGVMLGVGIYRRS